MKILRIAAVAALLFVVLFWQLGAASFWDPDEAIYAETSREMVRTGDWLAPYYNEQPFFDKPILFYWFQAAGMTIAGQNETGARLAPAIAAVALVAITAWLGTALISFEIGFTAALLLAASPPVFALARYAILDMIFTAFLFGGVSLLAVAALKDRPALQWPGYLLIALSVVTKGPLSFALCGLAFGLALLASVDLRRRLLALRFVWGLPLVVALALPWFVYMWLRFRGAFIDGYLLNENVSLFAANRFNTKFDPLFYFRVLAAGLLPWTGLAIGKLWDDVRAYRLRTLDNVDTLLWCWTIAIVAFFTASRFKLDHYVFPAAPALCLICARAWAAVRTRRSEVTVQGSRLGANTIGPILVLAGAGGGYFMIARLDLPNAAIAAPLLMLAAGIFVTSRISFGRRQLPRTPWVTLTAMVATYAAVIVWVLPALERQKVVPDVARWVNEHAGPDVRVGTYRLNRWSNAFRFYVDHHTSHMDGIEEARTFFAGPTPAYAVTTRQFLYELAGAGIPLQVDYEREGMWVTSGRALWRRREPPTRFVVVSRQTTP
ncbi:MAG TPA: glycosyltransferase family 39 protein [Vicinamibacterales bacterium]|nr:glycosyltransferase family 39 protein [Vicinamibacterales bacterium]